MQYHLGYSAFHARLDALMPKAAIYPASGVAALSPLSSHSRRHVNKAQHFFTPPSERLQLNAVLVCGGSI